MTANTQISKPNKELTKKVEFATEVLFKRFDEYIAIREHQIEKSNARKFQQRNFKPYDLKNVKNDYVIKALQGVKKHLEELNVKINRFIDESPENEIYYRTYQCNALTVLIEVDKKYQRGEQIVENDFVLPPSTVHYQKTNWDCFYASLFAMVFGGGVLGAIGAIIGGSIIIALSLPEAGKYSSDGAPGLIFLGAIGAIIGAAIAGFIGGVIGLVLSPLYWVFCEKTYGSTAYQLEDSFNNSHMFTYNKQDHHSTSYIVQELYSTLKRGIKSNDKISAPPLENTEWEHDTAIAQNNLEFAWY